MKEGNWIPLDKNLIHFLPRDRPYTILEAMFSFCFDLDNEDEKSEIAYSRIWSWSRSKVRRFTTDLKTGSRHAPDSRETGKRHEIRYIINNLEAAKDRQKTGKRQAKDRNETGTINPNKKEIYKEKVLLTSEEHKKLVDRFGEKGTEQRIENLNNYLCAKRKHYDSHYHTILMWEKKNTPSGQDNRLCTTPEAY